MPSPEARLWNALRGLKPQGYHFRRQVPLGRYFADFACHHPRLVVEVDGWTHGGDVEVGYDRARDAFIGGQGYRVLRVSNDDVTHNIDGVVESVLGTLVELSAQAATPTLDPSPQGGGR